MNELAVQGNQSVSQSSYSGRTGKSGNSSDSGDSFSAIFNKATESRSDNVKTETKSDRGKNESRTDIGKNEDKFDNNKNVDKKKEEEKTPEEYAALANSGSQVTNNTTPDDSEKTEDNLSVDGVEDVAANNVNDVENEAAPVIDQIIITDTDDANTETTVDENVTTFEEVLKDNTSVLETFEDNDSFTFDEQNNTITFKEPKDIGIQNTPALSIDTPDFVEGTDDTDDILIIPETNTTEETQSTETPDLSLISTTSLNVGQITTISPTINTTVAKDISNRQKTIINSFPAEYEKPIDEMTTEFLKANPNPTETQINTFFETMTNAIEQLVAKDKEIAELNNALDKMQTEMTAAASQMSNFQTSPGDLTVQETVTDLVSNFQRMFQEVAMSAQMTAPGTTSQLVLQLFPEHLGKLRIELTADRDGKITAKMQSGDATVRALLNLGLSDLIDCLKASGVDLKTLEVGKLEMELSNTDLGHQSNLQQEQQNQQNQQYGRQRQSTITRIMATDTKALTNALYNNAVRNSYIDENVSVEFTA